MASELTKKLNEGLELEDDDKAGDAIQLYEFIIKYNFDDVDDIDDEVIKAKEQAAYRLAGIFYSKLLFDQLIDLTK